ncbi:MAG: adenylate/guanylate cyclase domain-containing protein [Syntrophobacteraceae bacterium]
MNCPKCSFQNPANAKYCIECGGRMELTCPKCGTVTPHAGRFCMECGASLAPAGPRIPFAQRGAQAYTPKFLVDKILSMRSSIEGERKLVTVLFADVSNFTAIAERLDPEDVHGILDGTFRILMDEIHKVEGTVNQFTGDGIMALFGAPVAHEDHAQRACHAALRIQSGVRAYAETVRDRYGVDFSMRLGLNSGPVIVGAIGDDLRMDYTAVGDTTNLAFRLQSLAAPGTVAVSQHTHRLAEESFEFRSLGKAAVKGKAEPQDVFELIKPCDTTSRSSARAARGLSRFVGRKSALKRLLAAYEEASGGAGRIVAITGEPGVGKSRLLLELRNLLPPGDHTYLEGECVHYGESIAYYPVVGLLKCWLEVNDGDLELDIKKKIEKRLLELEGDLRGTTPPLQELLSVKVDDEAFVQLRPQQKRLRTFDAVRDLLLFASEEKPLVLAVEDLHWIDKTSEELLSYLIDFLPNSRVLIILLYRPEYTHPWGNKSYFSQIGLGQLDNTSSHELVRSILDDGDLSSELTRLILDKSAGNPLYIEEFTRSLLEGGVILKREGEYVLNPESPTILVPDSLQGLIASRIDRLEENIKKTVQVASVIGKDFAYRILQVTTGMQDELRSSLLNLQGMEFIYKKTLFPELEYIFKHALTQEVAYNSLLVARRKELHRKIGEAMREIYGERVNEYSGIISEHFLRGEDWERAFIYLNKAGDAAARLFAHTEARVHYSRALEVLAKLEPTVANRRRRVDTIIKLSLSSWRAHAPDQNLSLLMEAEEATRALSGPEGLSAEDTHRLARVHFWLGRVRYLRGDVGEAIHTFMQMMPVAQASQDPELIAIPSCAIGQAMEVLGYLPKARHLLEQAIPLLEATANWAEWVQAMGFLGTALSGMGQCAAGVEKTQQALARAQELHSMTGVSISYSTMSFAHLFSGDLPLAVTTAQAAVKAAEESGDRIYRYVGYGLWAWAAGRLGQVETAAVCLTRSLQAAEELGGQVILADVFSAVRAEVALHAQDLDEALTMAEQGVTIARAIEGIFGEGYARRVWGQALMRRTPPDWGGAELQLSESARLLESGENRMEMARSLTLLGSVCLELGRPTEAAEQWRKAAAQFRAGGADRELQQVLGLMQAASIRTE